MELLLVPVAVGMGTPPGSENTKHASTFKGISEQRSGDNVQCRIRC